MDVAAACAGPVQSLTGFADLNVPLAQVTGRVQDVAGRLNKMHIAADLDMTKTFIAAQEKLAGFCIELAEKRLSLEMLQTDLRGVQAELAMIANAESDLKELARSGMPLDEVRRQFDGLGRERLALIAKQRTLLAAQLDGQGKLTIDAVSKVHDYTLDLAKLNLSIRRELNNPIDEKEYLEAMNASMERLRRMVPGFIERIHGKSLPK